MGCPCQDKKNKQAASAAGPQTTYKIRLINWGEQTKTLTGKSSAIVYGDKKNGDVFKIRIEDYDAEPEMFVRL